MKPRPSPAHRFALISLVLSLLSQAALAQTVFVVRHGETDQSEAKDNPLLPAGEERAKVLAETLQSLGVNKIYVSDNLRTQQTARPLAERLGVKPDASILTHNHDAGDLEAMKKLVEVLNGKETAESDVVLVVYHSSLVPELLRRCPAQAKDIPDKKELKAVNNDLFVLSRTKTAPQQWTMVRLKYDKPQAATTKP